jgi:CRISPR-associated protein Cmr5
MKTLDQRRAHHAWEALEAFVKRVKDKSAAPDAVRKNEEAAKKFGTQVRKLPTRIVASGLGQALSFLVAKDYCPDLLRALNHWVLTQKEYPKDEKQFRERKPDELLREIVQRDCDFLRLKTAEALAYLQWLTRFAEAKGLTDNVTE